MPSTIYVVPASAPFYTKFLARFLETIDLSENLKKVSQVLRSVPNGLASLLVLVICLFAAHGFGSLAFHYDIYSSWTAIEPIRNAVVASMATFAYVKWVSDLAALVPYSLTLLPTSMEILGSRFSRFDIPAIQVTVWFFIVFDGLTDIPTLNATLAPYKKYFFETGSWAELGLIEKLTNLVGFLMYGLVWTLWLVVNSYFLELITILFAYAAVGFFWKSVGYWTLRLIAGRATAKRASSAVTGDDDDEDDFEYGSPRPSRSDFRDAGPRRPSR